MKDSKLAVILRSFSKIEISEFMKFLESPLFNNSNTVRDFFNIIRKYYPAFDHPAIGNKKLYKALFKNERYNENKIRQIFSKTTLLAEEFLLYKRFSRMEAPRENMLLKELADRNLDSFFRDRLKKAESAHRRRREIDGSYLYIEYSLLNTQRTYLESKAPVGKREKYFKEIEKEYEAFILYVVYKLLKYFNELHVQTKLLNLDYDYKMQKEIINFLDENLPKNYPVIEVYYYLIKMHINETDFSSYNNAYRVFKTHLTSFNEEDRKEIYVGLYNFTRLHALKQDGLMTKENFRITKEMIELDIHPLDGNFFAENSFITIFRTALIEGDIKWAGNFLNEYLDRLPPEKRDNVHTLCSAIYDYYTEDYENALNNLAKVQLLDFTYSIRVKNFQIRTLWMLKRYEEILYMIDSFRHILLSNKKIPEYLRTRFINFLNFSGRICKHILSDKVDKLPVILEELKEFPAFEIENKKWLIERVKELI